MSELLLRARASYGLKEVSRNCPQKYICGKTGELISRKETTAEHIYSALKLANFFLEEFEEFKELNRTKVYEILMFHDDVEIKTDDTCISDEKGRIDKEAKEKEQVKILAKDYSDKQGKLLLERDREYREKETPEAKFCKAIDKLDSIVHCLLMPEAYGEKTGFTVTNMRKWHGKAFDYSPTFSGIFEDFIQWGREQGYFDD